MRVVIAAAQTGGHINPGLAIANKIKSEEPDSEIVFIGTEHGLEVDLVPREGYKLYTIKSHGFSRRLTKESIKNILETLKSPGEAKKIIKEFNPDIVIGTGGFITWSVCYAAYKLNIPYVIHESNVLAGKATMMMAKHAKEILVGFEGAKKYLKRAKKVVVTGTPTKIKKIDYSEAQLKEKKQGLGLRADKPVVLVFGGSQGARKINESMLGIIKKAAEEVLPYQIIWAAGPNHYDQIVERIAAENIVVENIKNENSNNESQLTDANKVKKEKSEKIEIKNQTNYEKENETIIDYIKVEPYIYNMEEIMNVSDVLVCRSGAMTVTEAEKLGKPSIFIPFPFAAENHQEFNARSVEEKGGAKVILDKDMSAEVLDEVIREMVSDKENLKKMSSAIAAMSIDNVEDRIYDEICTVLQKN